MIPRAYNAGVTLPERVKDLQTEDFVEAMAYPEIDTPMYKPLVDVSTELFLPNINLIGQNTISLLETNQKFIEAYMVGLNHEFARELLWREFPTDQRGSYFRQFWDASTVLEEDGIEAAELREKLFDIPPLHRWSKSSDLGDHDHRAADRANSEELVLVIRGELLKKYPNAVIYAHRAQWEVAGSGNPDNTKAREFAELTAAEVANPPKSKLLTPLYEAKIEPDITFLGFDLNVADAKGEDGSEPSHLDRAGWFFVIKERPGEPRFGLDVDSDPPPNVWNDLSWKDVIGESPPGVHIDVASQAEITLTDPMNPPTDPEDQVKKEQFNEDVAVAWNSNMNAAEIAYVLYQVPVLVGVHATEMLPKTE